MQVLGQYYKNQPPHHFTLVSFSDIEYFFRQCTLRSLGSVLSNLQNKTETATMMTTISSNTTVNGSFQSVSATISSNLSIGSNLSVSGTIYPTALSMSTNPLYIQNGNAGITYANVSGTGQTIDGTAIYGWQCGVLGYTANGSDFAPGRNGITGTLF
jgi:hypothetical protein